MKNYRWDGWALTMGRLAAQIPPPRRHCHRYYGVLAPNAPLREQVRFLQHTSRPDKGIFDHLTGCFWPGPEILAINSVAENQPFDSTCHEKLRCNRRGRLMADS